MTRCDPNAFALLLVTQPQNCVAQSDVFEQLETARVQGAGIAAGSSAGFPIDNDNFDTSLGKAQRGPEAHRPCAHHQHLSSSIVHKSGVSRFKGTSLILRRVAKMS